MTVFVLTGFYDIGFYRHVLAVTATHEAALAMQDKITKATGSNYNRFEISCHTVLI